MRLKQLWMTQQNKFVFQKIIPLGINTFKGRSTEAIISLPYSYWGALAIISKSGYGKSVLLKRVYSYLLYYYNMLLKKNRCGVIFDMTAEDHYLSAYRNPEPMPLFKGETIFGFENLKNYAPTFVKDECFGFDHVFGFHIKDIDNRDFNSMHLNHTTIREFDTLIKNNLNKIDDFDFFVEQVNFMPTRQPKAPNKKKDIYKMPVCKLKCDHLINPQVKNAMISFLSNMQINEVFINSYDKRYKLSFDKDLLDGYVVVVNFHQAREFAPLYAGLILKDIYFKRRNSIREKKGIEAPVIIIEEADLLLPRDDLFLEQGSNKWLTEILRRGRKYGFYTVLATQQVSSINPMIKDHIQTWIIGSLTSKDLNFFEQIFSSEIMNVIYSLNQIPNERGAREWIVVYNNQEFDTFRPYNSPVKIHKVQNSV